MKLSNFEILSEVMIQVHGHVLDVHNLYHFMGSSMNTSRDTLVLRWARNEVVDYSRQVTIKSFELWFLGVSLFISSPRDPEMPLKEDRCLEFVGFFIRKMSN